MNAHDFQRNFAQSYFGLNPSNIKGNFPSSVWEKLDLGSTNGRPLIPGTTPNFHSSGSVAISVIIKQGNDYSSHVIEIPWSDDLDEKPGVMYAQHPLLGMIQHKDTCVYMRRFPARGYNRGHHSRSCSIVQFNERLTGHIERHDLSLTWSVFNPSYYSWEAAMLTLDSGEKVGVVLGRFLGIFIDEGRKYPRIAYRDEVVGFVQNNQPVVYDYTDQDVRDYIVKITGKQIKVK